MRIFALLAAALVATPVLAAEPQVWSDAPVPRTSILDVVSPADRAGRSAGPENGSPFSAIPSGSTASGGQTSSGGAPWDVGTPSVSR